MSGQKRYNDAVRGLEDTVREIQHCQARVDNAKNALESARARSSATQRKARGFLRREEEILEQARDRREYAIGHLRRSYEALRSAEWARAWGLPRELSDIVAYYCY